MWNRPFLPKCNRWGGVSGSLTLSRPPGVEAGATVSFTKEEAQGLVAALQKELTDNAVKLSEKQIDCMKPYIDVIFKELFPGSPPHPEERTPSFSFGEVKLGMTMDEVSKLIKSGEFKVEKNSGKTYFTHPLVITIGKGLNRKEINVQALHFFEDGVHVTQSSIVLNIRDGACNDTNTPSDFLGWLIQQWSAPVEGPRVVQRDEPFPKTPYENMHISETKYRFEKTGTELIFVENDYFGQPLEKSSLAAYYNCQIEADYSKSG